MIDPDALTVRPQRLQPQVAGRQRGVRVPAKNLVPAIDCDPGDQYAGQICELANTGVELRRVVRASACRSLTIATALTWPHASAAAARAAPREVPPPPRQCATPRGEPAPQQVWRRCLVRCGVVGVASRLRGQAEKIAGASPGRNRTGPPVPRADCSLRQKGASAIFGNVARRSGALLRAPRRHRRWRCPRFRWGATIDSSPTSCASSCSSRRRIRPHRNPARRAAFPNPPEPCAHDVWPIAVSFVRGRIDTVEVIDFRRALEAHIAVRRHEPSCDR